MRAIEISQSPESTISEPTADLPARRRELAAFLRARRDRMSPEAVGLVSGRRRRAPGLRREEVAQLAGVGVTWYTWLEQGRQINASSDVLEAIARTLRLDSTERDHMFRLADVSALATPPTRRGLEPEVQVVLDGLEPYPASVLNERYDLLGWNRAYEAVFPGITRAKEDERNILWQVFTVRPCPVTNYEQELPRLVATFRAAYAKHLSEPLWTDLVERLCAASPKFAELWARHEVAEPRNRLKHVRLDSGKELLLYSTIFNVIETPEARMTVYTPANESAASFIDQLRLALPAARGSLSRAG
jgi:transcriptional regulator with XRE-family HTH domain